MTTDIRLDLSKTAEEVAKVATEAAYLAIGIGVLGFHKAQVRRQALADAAQRGNRAGDLEVSLTEARKEVAKRVKDLDATVGQFIDVLDSTFDPVWQRLPESAQAVIQQAKATRDQVRGRISTFAA
jgi:hypothetical protein